MATEFLASRSESNRLELASMDIEIYDKLENDFAELNKLADSLKLVIKELVKTLSQENNHHSYWISEIVKGDV